MWRVTGKASSVWRVGDPTILGAQPRTRCDARGDQIGGQHQLLGDAGLQCFTAAPAQAVNSGTPEPVRRPSGTGRTDQSRRGGEGGGGGGGEGGTRLSPYHEPIVQVDEATTLQV